MTKKEKEALREELKGHRERAREIVGILNGPKADNEVLVYLRAQPGPCKGRDIAKKLGKAGAHVSRVLGAAVDQGKARRVGVGEYQAVPL